MTLYELTEQHRELYAMFEAGEIDADAFFDTLEGLDGEIDDKIESTCVVIKNKRAEVAAILMEAERLGARAKALQRDADRMGERLTALMQRIGRDRFESARHTVKFNKGERVIYTDEASVVEYLKLHHPEMVKESYSYCVSKNDVKKLFKAGEAAPGAEFVQTISIDIK